jgi:tetratricopeptide (TPR) repeat protein
LQPPYFEAIFRRANLQVFYLNELTQPAKDLAEICTKAISRDDWARALLLLGDIQLIQQQIFEAKQTYTKVSEQFRDRQTGALAKYKLAQLMYYNGEFGLSQAMLGAIKDNTSNDISNDAIKLNLTIMDNAAMDSIPTALKRFAYAQLLIYQRQYAPATRLLDSVANAFPGHPLSDEILWEKANISLRQNDTKTALEYLDRILQNFPTDILGDDALYTKARIYDFTLKNGELALKYYMEFLTNYPGSLYSVEVRKRVRDLRAKAG